MSRGRQENRQEVRGPRSALTSFLREKGIRPRNIVPAYQTQREPIELERVTDDAIAPAPAALPATPSSSTNPSSSSPREETDSRTQDERGAQDELKRKRQAGSSTSSRKKSKAVKKEEESESSASSSSTSDSSTEEDGPRVRVRIAQKESAKASKVAIQKKKEAKKMEKDSSDEDDYLKSFLNPTREGPYMRPKKSEQPNSLISFCSKCRRRFARALPTSDVAEPGEDMCGACLSVMTGEASKAASARRKKNAKRAFGANDEQVIPGGDGIRYPVSLKAMCIKLIADNIDLVEDFGAISSEAKTRLSEILSKERKLSNDNLPLFLTADEEHLALFDCSKIDSTGLRLIPAYCQQLRSLELGYCGHLTDPILDLISEKCPSLTALAFKGAYLVTDAAWGRLLASKRQQLDRLVLEQSPRLAKGSIESLVYGRPLLENEQPKNNTEALVLKALRLKGCMRVGDECLRVLSELRAPALVSLTLGQLNEKISSEAIIPVLERLGSMVRELDISDNTLLDDSVLAAIGEHCTKLRSVDLSRLSALTAEALVNFFAKLAVPLTSVRLSRLPPAAVTDEVFASILKSSASTLTELDVNGADFLTKESLQTPLPKLELLDLSWVRSVDDFVLKSMIDENITPSLKLVKIFGCNKVTEIGARKSWRSKNGGIVTIVGSEFD